MLLDRGADHAAKGATHSAVAGALAHEGTKQVTRNTRRLVIRHVLRSKTARAAKGAHSFAPRSSRAGQRSSGSRAGLVLAHGGGHAAAGAAASSRGSSPFAGRGGIGAAAGWGSRGGGGGWR